MCSLDPYDSTRLMDLYRAGGFRTLHSSRARKSTYPLSIEIPLFQSGELRAGGGSYRGESVDGSGGYGGARCSAYGLGDGENWTRSVSINMTNRWCRESRPGGGSLSQSLSVPLIAPTKAGGRCPPYI